MNDAVNIKIKNFFDVKALYQKILDNNYMKHNELYCHLENLLKQLSFSSFLDIGCGSAYNILNLLKTYKNTEYLGIDISNEAIKDAKFNAKLCNVNANFLQGDMLEHIERLISQKQKFDLIFSCFCIHHYDDEKKLELYKKIFDLLNSGGYFVMIDLIMDDNFSRQDYLDITMPKFYSTLKLLNSIEKCNLMSHVNDYDYPHNINSTVEVLNAIYFKNVSLSFKIEHYGVVICAK
jgi:SAM-dependent methyltransferase